MSVDTFGAFGAHLDRNFLQKFKGKVAYTIVNGNIVYDGFDIVENKAGKFINSNKKSL